MKKLLGLILVSLLGLAHAAELPPQKNVAAGRVTFEGGKPVTGEIDDYLLRIYGVSEAGEKVTYNPAVKNGAYKQKLVPGGYTFGPANIKVRLGETVFTLPLAPVGRLWNKSQDAEEGIVQDFLWKPTGARDLGGEKPSPNNHTHWYGLCMGMSFKGWRSDTNVATVQLPAGTKLVFTLTALSKSIDGRDLAPQTVEREWRPGATYPNDELNDLPPANYEITGVAKLPDGTTRPILFQWRGDYPKFATKATVLLESGSSSYEKPLLGWVTD